MDTPFFYIERHEVGQKQVELPEETSRHIIQVLRMKTNQQVNLTDGRGSLLSCHISGDHKKHCIVTVDKRTVIHRSPRTVSIGVSLLKNASRFEWFLEKATELGINEIIPLICDRTEREKFRHERLQAILVSAMLQSQQCWLPVLHEPIAYELLFRQEEVAGAAQKFIGHCAGGDKINLVDAIDKLSASRLLLVGPEGDFTPQEIELALGHHFIPVSLGDTRLRTETAALVASALLRLA